MSNEIVVKQFSEIFDTIFCVSATDQLYATDKKDLPIKPYTDTEQYKELQLTTIKNK